jgi:alpha-N-arabinofuranosidase
MLQTTEDLLSIAGKRGASFTFRPRIDAIPIDTYPKTRVNEVALVELGPGNQWTLHDAKFVFLLDVAMLTKPTIEPALDISLARASLISFPKGTFRLWGYTITASEPSASVRFEHGKIVETTHVRLADTEEPVPSEEGVTDVTDSTICVDVTQTGERISKYIYGQFIEHVGRCIYGGIWAEMLRDRKFYLSVGSKESAWEVIGPQTSVAMHRESPFVGDHTPQLRLPSDGAACGIKQGGLGLSKGRDYVGRVVVAGGPETSVEVTLRWGVGCETVNIPIVGRGYITRHFRFTSDATTDDGQLDVVCRGTGSVSIGAVSLMPADNVHGMRADTLKLLKELDAPVYRWPGGNFVSGYDWRDGIGPQDRRPPRKNPAWKGIEHNDFGINEFIVFCREVRAEPMIVVNSGLGDGPSAAQEVEYANGSTDTPMGKWRVANGGREPYNVRWWGIGNEMFGKWQLGHMSLSHYVQKHNLFANVMRGIDPDIKLIAVGAVGEWSEAMLANCANHTDLISEHFYRQAQNDVLQHVRQVPEAIRRIVAAHKDYRENVDALKGKDIHVAIDEWNYWYGEHVYGELGTRCFMKDALGIAAGLHEMIRNSDLVFMANYAQTVNVLGAVKTTKTAAAFEATGLVLKLYRHRFGTVPVQVTCNAHPLDVVAALTGNTEALVIAIVNPTEHPYTLSLESKGAQVAGQATRWVIAHHDPTAYNEPGKEPQVVIDERRVSRFNGKFRLPPYSVSVHEFPITDLGLPRTKKPRHGDTEEVLTDDGRQRPSCGAQNNTEAAFTRGIQVNAEVTYNSVPTVH